jgi:hypothetical protein
MPNTPKRKGGGCLRVFGFFAGIVILLIPLLYLEEDWRGAREFAAAKQRWQGAGYSLNPSDYYSAPVPDEQNLAALPVFELEPSPHNPKRLLAMRLSDATNEEKHGGVLYDTYTKKDLASNVAAAYAKAFAGQEPPASSLVQMEALYPILGELRTAAAKRPEFRVNVDFGSYPAWDRPWGPIIYEIRVAKLLSYHAELSLREKKPQAALEDIAISLRIARGVGKEPSLIGGLISLAATTITHRVVSEGLDQHAWNDAQLASLQDELKRMDALALFQFDMRGEAATFTIPFYAALKADPATVALTFPQVGLIRGFDQWEDDGPPSGNSKEGVLLWSIFASGWWDMNAARMLDYEYREADTVDPKLRRVDVKRSEEINTSLEVGRELPGGLAPWKLFFGVEAGPLGYSLRKFAQGQVQLDEDRIVCGLERYRLVHGGYPKKLDALVSACIDELPHDVMNGEPYHYRANADGTFLLYSVGWNQVDDGGTIALKSGYTKPQIDFDNGDWVWPMVPR